MFFECSRDQLLLKIMSEKCWVQCEVNRSRVFSVESNMPPKKKTRTEDTYLAWTDDEVHIIRKYSKYKVKVFLIEMELFSFTLSS